MQGGSVIARIKLEKLLVSRHGSRGSKALAHRCEKAAETKERQAAKKEIKSQLWG